MNSTSGWQELTERIKNFYCDHVAFEKQVYDNEFFYRRLYGLKKHIVDDSDELKQLSSRQILETVFSNVFNFVIDNFHAFSVFHKNFFKTTPWIYPYYGKPSIHNDVHDACLYTTLCMFINKTTRIRGKSLTKFVYNNSLEYYNDKNSNEYCTIEYPSDTLLKEVKKIRKDRNRLLSNRPVNGRLPEWQTVRKDLEYEWTSEYNLQVIDTPLKKEYRKIFNLYNEINNILNIPRDNKYVDSAKIAYDKFSSKLSKLKYENYLELVKEFLSYICENDKYYGMNIYRFEKEFKPYIITYEVNKMLACENDAEKRTILLKSLALINIHFPKLYKDFVALNIDQTAEYASLFYGFRYFVETSSRLIIDELVEKDYFGKDWESVFLNIINEMTESVFYNPKEIDCTVAPESDEIYKELLSYPVRIILS